MENNLFMGTNDYNPAVPNKKLSAPLRHHSQNHKKRLPYDSLLKSLLQNEN